MKKAVIIVAVLALLGLLGWQIYRNAAAKKAAGAGRGGRGNAVVAVEVAPVRQQGLREVARFTGSLTARSRFDVAPKIAGRLEKLEVNIGDEVKNGQVIALLDSDEYTQQMAQARAERLVAQANVEEARSGLANEKNEYARAAALHQREVASDSEYEGAKARLDALQARYDVAVAQATQQEAALKAAAIRLSYARIAAVWEGGPETRVIGERFADAGTMLRANDPIVSVLDLGSVTAPVYVIEREYARMQLGQSAAVTAEGVPGRVFTGTIARIAPLLREASRQARVEIEIPNPDRLLKPGMFVRAEVELARRENATVVPLAAVVRRNEHEGVFVADAQTKIAHFVPVTTGITQEGVVEITEPVLSGNVVTLGHHLLEDGGAILLPEPAAGGAAKPDAGNPPAAARTGGRS